VVFEVKKLIRTRGSAIAEDRALLEVK